MTAPWELAAADSGSLLAEFCRSRGTEPAGCGCRHLLDDLVIASCDWQPTRPFAMTRDYYERLGVLSARAARIALATCRRRARTAGELLRALELPSALFPLLDHDEVLGDRLLAAMRPDILTSHGVPRFVELNIDSALGGANQVDVICARFLAHYRDVGLPGSVAFDAPRSTLHARAAAIRTSLGLADGARVVLPHFQVGMLRDMKDFGRFDELMAPAWIAAAEHGLEMFAFPLDELTTDAQNRLVAGGAPVDAVFRPFVPWAQPASSGLAALARAVGHATVPVFTSEATMLVSNKVVLAWMWADHQRMSGPDRSFVEDHIPRTQIVDPSWAASGSYRQAVIGQDELVLKTGSGFGSTGVVMGAAVAPQTWRAALEQAVSDGGSVIQERVEPDRVLIPVAHRMTGEVTTMEVPFVLGPLVYRGEVSGLLVRHATDPGALVLSAGQGAVMNSALLVDAPLRAGVPPVPLG